jgi:hypothetical protein
MFRRSKKINELSIKIISICKLSIKQFSCFVDKKRFMCFQSKNYWTVDQKLLMCCRSKKFHVLSINLISMSCQSNVLFTRMKKIPATWLSDNSFLVFSTLISLHSEGSYHHFFFRLAYQVLSLMIEFSIWAQCYCKRKQYLLYITTVFYFAFFRPLCECFFLQGSRHMCLSFLSLSDCCQLTSLPPVDSLPPL